jgi:hypothetical protein
MEERSYRSTILDICIRWRRVVSFTLRPLYSQRNRPRYPLGGPKSRSGRGGEEIYLLPLPGNEPQPSRPQPVAIPTDISRWILCLFNDVEYSTAYSQKAYKGIVGWMMKWEVLHRTVSGYRLPELLPDIPTWDLLNSRVQRCELRHSVLGRVRIPVDGLP